MNKIIINLFDKRRKVRLRNKMKNYDYDFWEDIDWDDLSPEVKEAIEEYVRDCDDVSVWVD